MACTIYFRINMFCTKTFNCLCRTCGKGFMLELLIPHMTSISCTITLAMGLSLLITNISNHTCNHKKCIDINWFVFCHGLIINPIFFPVNYELYNFCSHFSSVRSAIERAFGVIKSSYCSVGTRRFRSRRYIAPLICNLTASMQNRRRIIFRMLRQHLNQ